MRIDFKPTFLVYRRDDNVVAGCPAAFYHLSHLLRLANSEVNRQAWSRLLSVRYPVVNGGERSPLFGTIRCPIFCASRETHPGGYPAAALPSSSPFAGALSMPALRLLLSR